MSADCLDVKLPSCPGMQIKKLQDELLSARQAAATAANSVIQQQDDTVQKQQLLALAADNARLAVALAESMAETGSLKKHQLQEQGHNKSSSRSPQDASPSVRVAATNADAEVHAAALQHQRLELLVSQLATARDQVADAASQSNQQQQLLQQQGEEMLTLRQQLLLVQEKYAQLQQSFLQRQEPADAAAAAPAAVAQVRDGWFCFVCMSGATACTPSPFDGTPMGAFIL